MDHGHGIVCDGENTRTTIPVKDRNVDDLVKDMGKMGFQGGQLECR